MNIILPRKEREREMEGGRKEERKEKEEGRKVGKRDFVNTMKNPDMGSLS